MPDSALELEYEALRSNWGVVEQPRIQLLSVSGEDRRRFLQGMVTCDVEVLEPGQGAYGFFTDAKGHILSDGVVRSFADRLWLELPEATLTAIKAHLEHHIVADRVEVHRSADTRALTIAGRRSGEHLAALTGEEHLAGAPRWSHQAVEMLGVGALRAAEHRMGIEAFTLWAGAEPLATLRARLSDLEQLAAPRAVSWAAAEIVRVEGRVPLFGRDFGPENLPQETGVEEAVSYDKGCYLGQEVVARLHYRGRVSRQIRPLRFAGESLPPLGARLSYDGREAGRVTSAVRSPSSGALLGLGMVKRHAAEPGSQLECENARGAVVL